MKNKKSFKFLAIDASSPVVSVAVALNEHNLFEKKSSHRWAASKLIGMIEQMMKQYFFKLKDIDAFIVGRGPGSFTGLRIAYSLIKGFALALKKPVVEIESFLAIAQKLKFRYNRIVVVSDARKGLVYAKAYQLGPKIIAKSKIALYQLDKVVSTMADWQFVTYDQHLRKQLPKNSQLEFDLTNQYPQAKVLLRLGKELFLKGKTVTVDKIEPLYVHPQTCQIRQNSR